MLPNSAVMLRNSVNTEQTAVLSIDTKEQRQHYITARAVATQNAHNKTNSGQLQQAMPLRAWWQQRPVLPLRAGGSRGPSCLYGPVAAAARLASMGLWHPRSFASMGSDPSCFYGPVAAEARLPSMGR